MHGQGRRPAGRGGDRRPAGGRHRSGRRRPSPAAGTRGRIPAHVNVMPSHPAGGRAPRVPVPWHRARPVHPAATRPAAEPGLAVAVERSPSPSPSTTGRRRRSPSTPASSSPRRSPPRRSHRRRSATAGGASRRGMLRGPRRPDRTRRRAAIPASAARTSAAGSCRQAPGRGRGSRRRARWCLP